MNPAEATRRQSNTQRLRAFFEAHPMRWIPATDLEEASQSRQAWRSRVSDLRLKLEKEGAGTIENRLTCRHRKVVLSEYRFLPHTPIGRDSTRETPALPLFDADAGPWSHR
mgnify:CR=1 FL=1